MTDDITASEVARMVDRLTVELQRLGDRIDAAMSRHVTLDRYDAEMGEIRRDLGDLGAQQRHDGEARERLRLLVIGSIACPLIVAFVWWVIISQGSPAP